MADLWAVQFRSRPEGSGVFALFAWEEQAKGYAAQQTEFNIKAAVAGVLASALERDLHLDYQTVYNERREQLAEVYGVKAVAVSFAEAVALLRKHCGPGVAVAAWIPEGGDDAGGQESDRVRRVEPEGRDRRAEVGG